MSEVTGLGFSLTISLFLLGAVVHATERGERPWVVVSFLSHLASAAAMLVVVSLAYGRGDLIFYFENALEISQATGFTRVSTGELVLALVQAPGAEPAVPLQGSSTGSMFALCALLQGIIGPSLYGTSLLFAMFAFLGKYLLFRALSERFSPRYRRRIMLGTLFVPSLVFWTSAIHKEALALLGLGLLTWGLHCLSRKRFVVGACSVATGGTCLALFKAYLLVPSALGCGVFALARRSGRGRALSSAAGAVLGLCLAIGLIALVTAFAPRYMPHSAAEEARRLQEVGQLVRGGSSYSLQSGSTPTLVVSALVSSLFRPFPWEISNAMLLASAVESTAFLGLFLLAWRRAGTWGSLRRLWRDPNLLALWALVVVGAIGVGIATTNLGSLSRYRTPLLPFYVSGLLILSASGNRAALNPGQPPRELAYA